MRVPTPDQDDLAERDAWRRMLDQAPGYVLVTRGPEHLVEFVNKAHRGAFDSGDWVGNPLARTTATAEVPRLFKLLDEVQLTSRAVDLHLVEVRLRRTPDGPLEKRCLSFVCAPVAPDEAGNAGVFCEGFDITEQRTSDVRAAALAEFGKRVRDIEDPDGLAAAAGEILGRTLQVSRAGYGTVVGETLILQRHFSAEGLDSLAGSFHFRDYGSYIDELKSGKTVAISDAASDARTRGHAKALQAISGQALINVPVIEGGELVALFFVLNAEPREWSEDDVSFLAEFASRTRTAVERRRAEAVLRENEARLRFLDALGKETAQSTDADAILAITTRMTGEHLGVSICAYADMEPDQDHFTIRGDWSAPGSPTIVGYYSLALFGQLAVKNLHAGLPLVINDNRTEIAPEEAATFQNIGIGATICMPLVKRGRLTALMAIHDKNPRRWSAAELATITEVTERSWAHVERVRSDASAREAAERTRLATQAAAIGTWDYDPVTGVLEWDARSKALFGLSPKAKVTYEGAFLGRLHPDDRERVDRAVRRVLSAQPPEALDIEYRTIGLRDGKKRWLAATGEAIFSQGRAIRLIGTVIDITERKRAERHLKILNETGARVAAERDLATIVKMIADAGIELCGAEYGAFLYTVFDEAGAASLHHAVSGALHDPFATFSIDPDPGSLEAAFTGSEVVRCENILEDPRWRGRTSTAASSPVSPALRSLMVVPVISRSGEVLGGLFFGHGEIGHFRKQHERALLGIAGHAATAIDNGRLFQSVERELGERRRAEAALQTLNATLEQRVIEEVAERSRAEEQLRQAQKMEAVGQLTGGIAHDFNNMLAVVIGGLNLVQRKLTRGELDVGRFMEGALDGAQRAASLTQRLLAFSRQQPLAAEPIAINRLVSGMSELLTRTLGETIHVETVLGAGLWQVRADQAQLESAILNLSVNARDAMPGGGKLTIETANAQFGAAEARQAGMAAGEFVLVAVSDTGTGMDAPTKARAFEPFFTTKGVGKGTGLGLSQVYGFVRQSGGNVKIYSELGLGTTVKIYLPRFVGPPGAEPPERRRRASAGGGTETILVVEDDDRVRAMSVEALADLGYRVIAAAGAAEAIRIIEGGQAISLLFTDVVMPEMSGRELVERLRTMVPDLKVLYTTGYTRNVMLGRGELDQGVSLLTKPFSVDDLAAKIRQSLDG